MIKNISPILITGAAGFIGAAIVSKLLSEGEDLIGIDNLNSYYDPSLKKKRLDNINSLISNNFNAGKWNFNLISIEDKFALNEIFRLHKPKTVINLAAQAGVRYSIENPSAYIQSNLVGFANILECCRNFSIDNLIFASSSSVYGGNKNLPFDESQSVNHPVSLYAASKKSNELMAHTYSHLFGIPCTGLRFFTVYGPWGRPDMAPMIFAKSILQKKSIKVFNFGQMKRDFTYIDDIVEAIYRCCYKPANINLDFDSFKPDSATSFAPYRIFNIGNSKPVELLRFINLLEDALGIKAIKELQPIQPGDVVATAANTNLIEKWIGFKPNTSLEIGIENFAKWYIDYF